MPRLMNAKSDEVDCFFADQGLDFQPPVEECNFFIVCPDILQHGDKQGQRQAFGLQAEHISRASSFFRDLIGEDTPGEELYLEVQDSYVVVGIVLSAAFDLDKWHLGGQGWDDLLLAIDLARKWGLNSARPAIFQEMLSALTATEDWDYFPGFPRFVCEAAVQGETTLSLVRDVLELRKRSGRGPMRAGEFQFSKEHIFELGAQRFWEVNEFFFELARDGVLI